MQVSVESPSNIERKLTVVVPFERIDEAFEKRLVKIAKTAKVKGFRPGKVPLDHVKQMYGQTARQEALSEVIQSSLYSALHQEKLQPVGVPMVEPKAVMPGQPLEYVATIEIMPVIKTVNFQVAKLEKEMTTIQETDINNVIDKLRQQHAKWNVVERGAKENDQVLLDFTGTMDGKPFAGGEAKNYPIILGSKMMISGFEEGLLGAKNNEERVIDITFPENYFAKEVAGKAAQFKIQVKKVYEPQLPELDETFVKKLGVKNGHLDELKTEIKKNLLREIDRQIKSKLKAKIFNQLLEQNPLEVPKSLIEKEAKRIHHQLHPHHGNEDHAHSADEMATFDNAAKQNVILGLLVAELIREYNLLPDAVRVDAFIQELASSYEKPDEIINWYQKNKKNRAEIEMQILEEQVMEKLLERIEVTDKMISYTEFATAKAELNPTE